MSHLLDANAWIDWLRRGQASGVHPRLMAVPPGTVFLCSVVLGELIYGAVHGDPKQLAKNMASIAKVRKQAISLPYDDAAAEHYGRVRDHLARLGMPIGPNDLMIASIALARHLTVVTHNTSEFSRVPGLLIEDWQ